MVEAEVFSLLEPLATSSVVDDRIRFAAQTYLSTAHALDGESTRAVQLLEDYPGASLSPALLDGDQRWIWPLVAEGLTNAGRHGEGVIAWGKLHSLLQLEAKRKLDDEADSKSLESAGLFDELALSPKADLAIARAFEAEPFLSDDDCRRFLSDDNSLVRAVGVWTLVRKELADSPDAEAVETLQSLFNDVSSDFLAIRAADRASELSVALGAVSGPERMVIGALVPISGPNRAVGYRALAGMLIAQRAFHAAGEPAVTLIIEDSHKGVAAGYERLVNEGALAVIGPLHTVEARELLKPAAEHGVPVMTLAADRIIAIDEQSEESRQPVHSKDDDPAKSDESGDESPQEMAGPPVFRNFVDSVAEARAAARISFESLGDRRAAVVYPNMGYGRVLARTFVDEFRRQGGEVVTEVEYDRQASDFVELARQVARSNPDAIFLPDTGAKVAEISAFFAQEQLWGLKPGASRPSDNRSHVHYLGTSLWQDPLVLHQAASYVDGALIPAWYSSQFDDAATRQFAGGFEAIYDTGADHFVAFAYDSVARLRTYLLERGVNDAEGITEALRQQQWEFGVTGRNYFGDDGEPRRELRYLTIDDGEWAIYDETVITPLDGRRQAELEAELDDEDLESIDEEESGSDLADELQ